jgi:glucan biosynthesis protein C
MRYISDASYWVYLVHLPIVSLIPGYLAGLDMSPFFKFTIVLSLTTGIGFLTYHWLVRSTFIGKFLSGRRISEKSLPVSP